MNYAQISSNCSVESEKLMCKRNNHSSAFICVICGHLPLVLAIVGTSTCCSQADAQLRILRWDIEATVVEVGDPDNIFTTVRLGDPVKGFLSYDAAAVAAEPDPNDILYEFQPFVVAGMTIENPRDNSRIVFEPDREILAFVEIFNDVNNSVVGKFDGVSALQSVVSPEGFTGFATAIGVDLYGPPSARRVRISPRC